jgi:5-methylcytosine-specific restriction protein A
MPIDKLVTGDAILEVDHVEDLAPGGADEPSNMVALCPNCHASKTRGENISKRRRQLSKIAREKDRQRVAAESSRD